jgi:hypothetical protein
LRFLEAIYDKSKDSLIFNSSLLATYSFGPWAASKTAKITLEMILGRALILELPFQEQKYEGESAEPRISDVILEEVRRFHPYSWRSGMSIETEKPVDKANC